MKTKEQIINEIIVIVGRRQAVHKALSLYEEEVLKEIDNLKIDWDNLRFGNKKPTKIEKIKMAYLIADFRKELKSKIKD